MTHDDTKMMADGADGNPPATPWCYPHLGETRGYSKAVTFNPRRVSPRVVASALEADPVEQLRRDSRLLHDRLGLVEDPGVRVDDRLDQPVDS